MEEDLSGAEKLHIEVLLAYGMLHSGDVDRAEAAFELLSREKDEEIQLQGLLGLAESLLSKGERERQRVLCSPLRCPFFLTQFDGRVVEISW